MSIAASSGGINASTVGTVTSFTGPTLNPFPAAGTYLIGVMLSSTSSSVTGITDNKGNVYAKIGVVNGTGIRVELWYTFSVGSQANVIATIAISPACQAAACHQMYSGTLGSTSIGNTHSTTGNSVYSIDEVAIQEGGNFTVSVVGFACVSGPDTATTYYGVFRQGTILSGNGVGAELFDNNSNGIGTLRNGQRISAVRQWAAFSAEIRGSGLVATPYAAPSYCSINYPTVNNVRSGTVYGLGTGTMTEPAIANVKNGVQYGAGGTEFTGTYRPASAAGSAY